MGRKLVLPASAEKEAKKWMEKVLKANELKRVQCVLLGARGVRAKEIMVIVGMEKASSVRRIWQRYRKEGVRIFLDNRGKNRGRAYWTEEIESQFLEPYKEKALSGKLVTVKEIQLGHKKALGRKVSLVSTYNLLHRHGWRKIVPRPSHPKHNRKDMERFKEAIFPPDYDPYEG